MTQKGFLKKMMYGNSNTGEKWVKYFRLAVQRYVYQGAYVSVEKAEGQGAAELWGIFAKLDCWNKEDGELLHVLEM